MEKTGFWHKMCGYLLWGLCLWGILLCAFPTPSYSTSEKRFLAEIPIFSAKSLWNGTYTAGWSNYVAERLPGRGALRHLHAVSELTLGKREVGGVIYCLDGSLTRRMSPDGASFEKNLRMIARFSERAKAAELPLTIAIAPRRIDLFPETLPTGYEGQEDRKVYETGKKALPDAVFLTDFTSDEWFKTDHHWTQKGAYRAYLQLASYLGYSPVPADGFTLSSVTEHFWGTTASAAGIPGVAPDTIFLWSAGDEEEFQVKREGKLAPFAGFYDFSAADGADPYQVFLGGNCGLLEITKGAEDARPTLLVIRDSFASPLLPFLARHYRILAVDPRYDTTGLQRLLPQVDRILFLMGMQTVSETSLPAGLLK